MAGEGGPAGQDTGVVGGGQRPPRRGWRERLEAGLYRAHRVNCPATRSRKPGVNCTCPYQAHLLGDTGRRYPQNLQATSLTAARAEKERRQKAGKRGPAAPGLTVSEFFWDTFLPKSQLRPATKRNYARVFRSYLEPIVGRIALAEMSEEDAIELVAHLEKHAERRRRATRRRNPDWVRQQLIPMRSAITTAIRWRRIDQNPLRRLDLPDAPPRRPGETDVRDDPRSILSFDQVMELCLTARDADVPETMSRRDESFFRATYDLALRNSEARGLRWGDIDFDSGEIHIVRQIDPVTREESGTKGKRSRVLPADEPLLRQLESWRSFSVDRAGYDPVGYVWHGRNPEQPMPIGLPTRRIGEVQRLAGLVDPEGNPRIVLHGLRHSRASHLLLAGIPMLEVSRFLGHTSQLITAETYSHLVPDEEFAEIKALFASRRLS